MPSKDKKGARLVPGIPVCAGQVLAGRYRVEELLGSGPCSLVVSARHVHTRKPATLKILTAFTEEQACVLEARLRRVRRAARLRNPRIARIVEIGTTEDGLRFIATERARGKTLDAELAAREKLPADEAVRLILQACEALAEAHAIGIVHGNVKPRNLLLGEDGDLQVLDFGMGSPIQAIGDASASAWFGSPAYLAPEQVRDPDAVDARADVWALGVVLYEMIAGAIPFHADTVSGMLVAVVMDRPALLTDAPYELARVVARCLEKDPAARFASVEELARALAPFAGDEEEGARLAERVKAAAETPPPSDPLAIDPDEDEEEPEPAPAEGPPPRPRRADAVTSPSLRVLAHRRKRRNQMLLACAAATTTIVVASAMALSSEEDEPAAQETETTSATLPAAPARPVTPPILPRAATAPAVPERAAPAEAARPRPQTKPAPAPRQAAPALSKPKRAPPKARPEAPPRWADDAAIRNLFDERK